MDITFHGAAQTVTGSRHLLKINGQKILLDGGLYQGSRAEAQIRNREFQFDPAQVDALILSHAHIDHSGALPALVKAGYRGPIYATPATCDLCEYMLRDSGRIQESDAAFMMKRAAKRGERVTIEPLYTEADAEVALKQFVSKPLHRPFEVAEGVTATFYEAGHILGSASIVLDITEGRRKYRVAFSGDIGRLKAPILNDPVFLQDIDHVIMESTYGTKSHRPHEEAFEEFTQVAKATVERGGKLIVPSFAVGRAQEITYALNQLMRSGEIPPIPVYVDSPLATNVANVFRQHADLYDIETRAFMSHNHGEVFTFKSLKYTQSVDESKAINDQKGPLVIISASGMCESGRILHHLRNNVGDPRNTILIVSWQAPNTLGRRLADQETSIRIFGETFQRQAQVVTINGYSGHAGRDYLLKWAGALQPRVKNIFLVHGEPASMTALGEGLREQGPAKVYAPLMHETVRV